MVIGEGIDGGLTGLGKVDDRSTHQGTEDTTLLDIVSIHSFDRMKSE